MQWVITLVIPQVRITAQLMNLLSLPYCALKGIFLFITICSPNDSTFLGWLKSKPNSRSKFQMGYTLNSVFPEILAKLRSG